MIAVLQRVNSAAVYADGEFSGEIGKGLYILLGVEKNDEKYDAELLAEKIAKLRIFCDENGKMNLSVNDIAVRIISAQREIGYDHCFSVNIINRKIHFTILIAKDT